MENPATEHTGANDGSVPVELYTSTLLDAGESPAIPLATPAPSPSSPGRPSAGPPIRRARRREQEA